MGIQKTFLNEEKSDVPKSPNLPITNLSKIPNLNSNLICQIIQSTTRGLLYNPNNYYPITIIQNRKKNTLQIYPKLQLLGIQNTLLYLSLRLPVFFVENFKMNQDDLINFEGFSESGKGSDTRGL